jgi:hypothetical protein
MALEAMDVPIEFYRGGVPMFNGTLVGTTIDEPS